MDILKCGIVTTRKEHVCHGCQEKFPPKTQMHYQAIADGGEIYSTYMCPDCEAWCKNKKCKECYEFEQAFEGFIRECKSCS